MPSWEPDPTIPAEQLPLFSEALPAARRRVARGLGVAVALVVGAATLIVTGHENTARAVLLAYLFGGFLLLRTGQFIVLQRTKPRYTKPFERVDLMPGGVEVAGREIGVRLPDGRWLIRRSSRKQHGIVTAQPRLWVLRQGDRASFLVVGTGMMRGRIKDTPPVGGTPPPEPAPDAWAEFRRSSLVRRGATLIAVLAVTTALLIWVRLGYPAGDRSFTADVLGLAAFCSGFLALVVLLQPFSSRRPRKWTELSVEPGSGITIADRRIRVEGRAVRLDGSSAKFVVPRSNLVLALEFASGGSLWTTGSLVRPQFGRRASRIRFQLDEA
ncbi:hypothetical protein [Amycolatopsis sp. NPDC050768]|uniref:hypothetical protein n=1 Tax=Amycolatopsis sp. NPDC050768 TaxID=3154839 RepID=UPI0033C8BE81